LKIYSDLHIHIGSAQGKPIKITASKNLTVKNIIEESIRKGLNFIGLVDCLSPWVIGDLEKLMGQDILYELPGGGLSYQDKLIIFLGAEVEVREGDGIAHTILYFPYLKSVKEASQKLSKYIKNISLGTQRCDLSSLDLLKFTEILGGIYVPAHVFTPFKSYYGNCTDRLERVFRSYFGKIYAIELGLSADSFLAGFIKELEDKIFFSNSDAHSLDNMAREYNLFYLDGLNFFNFINFLKNKSNVFLIENYGFNPKLGKYHRSFCLSCNRIQLSQPPVLKCEFCGSSKMVLGVLDRITIIKNNPFSKDNRKYNYRIPLHMIPGIGEKTIERLVNLFGSHIRILNEISYEDLKKSVGEKIARNIIKARKGEFEVLSGGGGYYGKLNF